MPFTSGTNLGLAVVAATPNGMLQASDTAGLQFEGEFVGRADRSVPVAPPIAGTVRLILPALVP